MKIDLKKVTPKLFEVGDRIHYYTNDLCYALISILPTAVEHPTFNVEDGSLSCDDTWGEAIVTYCIQMWYWGVQSGTSIGFC